MIIQYEKWYQNHFYSSGFHLPITRNWKYRRFGTLKMSRVVSLSKITSNMQPNIAQDATQNYRRTSRAMQLAKVNVHSFKIRTVLWKNGVTLFFIFCFLTPWGGVGWDGMGREGGTSLVLSSWVIDFNFAQSWSLSNTEGISNNNIINVSDRFLKERILFLFQENGFNSYQILVTILLLIIQINTLMMNYLHFLKTLSVFPQTFSRLVPIFHVPKMH